MRKGWGFLNAFQAYKITTFTLEEKTSKYNQTTTFMINKYYFYSLAAQRHSFKKKKSTMVNYSCFAIGETEIRSPTVSRRV